MVVCGKSHSCEAALGVRDPAFLQIPFLAIVSESEITPVVLFDNSDLWDPLLFVDRWSTPELLLIDGQSLLSESSSIKRLTRSLDGEDKGPPAQSYAAFSILQKWAFLAFFRR